mmetsp:Transcript_32027/g.84566  ORF Transcript_32027/g.84566 Transcript_32027/m.84566 type:complete len:114 (-) Transcript_32027:323-664(-)
MLNRSTAGQPRHDWLRHSPSRQPRGRCVPTDQLEIFLPAEAISWQDASKEHNQHTDRNTPPAWLDVPMYAMLKPNRAKRWSEASCEIFAGSTPAYKAAKTPAAKGGKDSKPFK